MVRKRERIVSIGPHAQRQAQRLFAGIYSGARPCSYLSRGGAAALSEINDDYRNANIETIISTRLLPMAILSNDRLPSLYGWRHECCRCPPRERFYVGTVIALRNIRVAFPADTRLRKFNIRRRRSRLASRVYFARSAGSDRSAEARSERKRAEDRIQKLGLRIKRRIGF